MAVHPNSRAPVECLALCRNPVPFRPWTGVHHRGILAGKMLPRAPQTQYFQQRNDPINNETYLQCVTRWTIHCQRSTDRLIHYKRTSYETKVKWNHYHHHLFLKSNRQMLSASQPIDLALQKVNKTGKTDDRNQQKQMFKKSKSWEQLTSLCAGL